MPYATNDMVTIRLRMINADEDSEAIAEFLTTAHAEVSAVLRRYGLEPDSITASTTDYELLQAAEADMAAGLLAEAIPGEHDKSSAQERHILYIRGRENLEMWASMRADEAASEGAYKVKRVRSKPAFRRDYDEYLN